MNGSKISTLQSKHNNTLVELENYQLLVESVEDYAIFLLDTDGRIMSWNKGAERNKGYSKQEIIGKHFSTFYMEEDVRDRKPERELEIAKRVGRVEDEDWRVRKDGSKFWANVVITALFDSSGKHVGFAKVTRDLSERKQHEDDLRKANSVLREQQKELKILNEAKDEFISMASHQLRTPATAIKQLLGLLLEGFQGELLPDQQPLIQKAYETNDRQIDIVNSLLNVAQLDAGKVVLKKAPVNCAALLSRIINDYADTFSNRDQIVTHNPRFNELVCLADEKYLRMALENLVDNASKYTYEHGTITITVSPADDGVKITIKDSGVGIPQESIPLLFQKFSRIPNDLSQKVSGTGLGLYWVREIIHLHGGRIEVESVPQKGTTFTVHLPCPPSGGPNA